MSLHTDTTQRRTLAPRVDGVLASVALIDAYTDFTRSRQAMNCTKTTMKLYRNTAGKFLQWIEGQSLTDPANT